jgi:hypothetical protein
VLPGKKAIVSSRVPGRAFSVLALPDQTVDEGEELMWVESRQPGDPPPTIMLPAPMAGLIAKVDMSVDIASETRLADSTITRMPTGPLRTRTPKIARMPMKTAELMKTMRMHQKMIQNKQGIQIRSYPRYEMKCFVKDYS